ncbi:hypothetical protein HDF16_005455 [Granulicella aggregans]|uniref:Uncharacterized protein n=1 Tax=Granulicella aggregans TaxID=474949 RepID=A0A7W7ZJI9_9BACT|nr:hypothetical protein [Granulicella aggregans]
MHFWRRFLHRRNVDGSWDSICLACFQNAVTNLKVNFESQLVEHEDDHICKSGLADRTPKPKKPSKPHSSRRS